MGGCSGGADGGDRLFFLLQTGTIKANILDCGGCAARAGAAAAERSARPPRSARRVYLTLLVLSLSSHCVGGTYNSAVASAEDVAPPAIRTSPWSSSVAVWPRRVAAMLPVALKVPAAGL